MSSTGCILSDSDQHFGSQVVTKETKAFEFFAFPLMKTWVCGRGSLENELGFTYCFDWELLWNDFTMVNKFSAEDKCPWICADKVFQSVEQQVPNPAIITWLASTKAPKHVLTKGLKLNFQKSLMTYLQQQIHTTNFLWQMKLACQFN